MPHVKLPGELTPARRMALLAAPTPITGPVLWQFKGAHVPRAANVTNGILAAVKQDTLELTMYGGIGEDFLTGKGITPASVKGEIDKAGKFSRISVHINSMGGSVFDGVAIHNLLRAQKKPIAVYVDGIAASAASVIAMAGDTRVMGRGSLMMIHAPSVLTAGNAADLRKMADLLDAAEASMADTYMGRCGKSKDEVLAIMSTETWMSAEDAVSQGFATGIAGEGREIQASVRNALKKPAEDITVIRERFKIKHTRSNSWHAYGGVVILSAVS